MATANGHNASKDLNSHAHAGDDGANGAVAESLSNSRSLEYQSLDSVLETYPEAVLLKPINGHDDKPQDVAGDLPNIPQRAPGSGMRTVHTAPHSLASMMGNQLNPTQVIRSLSFDCRPEALSVIFDLPVGDAASKSKLLDALDQVNDELRRLPSVDELHQQGGAGVLPAAIPTAPDSIPPTARAGSAASDYPSTEYIGTGTMIPKESVQIATSRRVESVTALKHDIEVALKQGYTRNLVIAILQALLAPFLYGWNIGLLNVPQEVIQNEVTGMDKTQWALLNTLISVGGMVGALGAGPVQDKMGRKKAMLLIDALMVLSAIIAFLYAEDELGVHPNDPSGYWIFWVSRFIAGMGIGAETAVIPTYLGEIAPSTIRGAVGTFHQVMICFGIVVVNVMGYSGIMGGVDTWSLLFIPNAFPVIQMLTAFSFPESPKWLFQHGHVDDARKSLQHLRMTNDVRMDMNMMKTGFAKNESFASRKDSRDRPLLDDDGLVLHEGKEGVQVVWQRGDKESKLPQEKRFGIPVEDIKVVKWAVIIAVMLMFMQQLCGINAIMFYSASMLDKAGIESHEGKWLGTVGINTASLLSVVIPIYCIDRAGRRVLLVVSGIMLIFASVGASVVILINEAHDTEFASYASIAFLILFVIGFQTGIGPIPWLMMAEISPMQYRGPIVSLATMMNWLCVVVVGQFSGLFMESNVKLFGFALCTLLGILFTLKYIPETNGKTASEIQNALKAL